MKRNFLNYFLLISLLINVFAMDEIDIKEIEEKYNNLLQTQMESWECYNGFKGVESLKIKIRESFDSCEKMGENECYHLCLAEKFKVLDKYVYNPDSDDVIFSEAFRPSAWPDIRQQWAEQLEDCGFIWSGRRFSQSDDCTIVKDLLHCDISQRTCPPVEDDYEYGYVESTFHRSKKLQRIKQLTPPIFWTDSVASKEKMKISSKSEQNSNEKTTLNQKNNEKEKDEAAETIAKYFETKGTNKGTMKQDENDERKEADIKFQEDETKDSEKEDTVGWDENEPGEVEAKNTDAKYFTAKDPDGKIGDAEKESASSENSSERNERHSTNKDPYKKIEKDLGKIVSNLQILSSNVHKLNPIPGDPENLSKILIDLSKTLSHVSIPNNYTHIYDKEDFVPPKICNCD